MRLNCILCAVFFTASANAAVADPVEIIVRGGHHEERPAPRFHYFNPDYVYGSPWSSGNFNPGIAAANAMELTDFKSGVGGQLNLERMRTLMRTGGSITQHQLRCQKAYPDSYDLVTDTYFASNGLPRPCRL